MAREINRSYYKVSRMNGNGGLATHNEESFELLIEEINEIIARAKAQGYDNDEKWLIMLCQMHRIWDDNDMIILDSIVAKAYAKYDNGVVTKLEEEA